MEFVASHSRYAEAFLKSRLDPETIRFNPLMPMDLETIRKSLDESGSDLAEFQTQDAFRWFVKVNGSIVGNASLKGINRMMGFAEIGYGVDAVFRGQGYATQLISKLVSMIFNETPLRKIIAYVHEENIASRRGLEKNGFKLEGILREQYLIQEIPVNEVFYGLLRREWKVS